ncbi:MAG TPA: glutamyl-tRNA reductase [Planctomycetota bacterium]|nr:glutamyl-tRNA reductase [Planctomycetota bacterium]
MERIAIAGLSLTDVELPELERAKARVVGREVEVGRELADVLAASDLVVLSTCNRLEVAYAREEGHPPDARDLGVLREVLGLGEDAARLHLHTGRGAARHLFRVAGSLDSLVLGEDQILAQVREAFERAEAARLCGGLLRPLFVAALEVGKQVRSRTELSSHPVSVVSIAVGLLRAHFAARTPRVAVLGAGAMGELVARHLTDAGIGPLLFVNRDPQRAERLAVVFAGRATSLEAFRAAPPELDALVSATTAPQPVLSAADLARIARGAPLYAVDLALPRDLEPGDQAHVEVVDLESLRERAGHNRALRRAAAVAAEALVEAKIDVFARRLVGRALSQTLAELQAETTDILERELAALRSERLGELPAVQREAVERWARMAFGRLAHAPVSALKRFASSQTGVEGESVA